MINRRIISPYMKMQMVINKQSACCIKEPRYVAQCPILSFTHEMIVDDGDIKGNSTYNPAFDSAMSSMQGRQLHAESSKAQSTRQSLCLAGRISTSQSHLEVNAYLTSLGPDT